MTSQLFSPIRVGGLDLANRVVVSPMCQYSATEGVVSDWHLIHLGGLALSGAGLVIMEATGVEPRGRISPACPGLWNDQQAEAVARMLASIRRYAGARFGVQLAHAGRKASCATPWNGGLPIPTAQGGWTTVGPSPVPFDANWPTPEALDEAGIQALVQAFADAARRADRAGFDLAELHGAHGYLLHEFLSPISNKRTDAYGGSRENRMRFPLMVFDAVRAVWPRAKALGMRITGSDWIEGGWTIEDAVAFASELKSRGADFVDVSSAGIAPQAKITLGPGYQAAFAERVRAATGLKTMAVGLIVDPKLAEEIVASGKADMVALGRTVLDDPRWPWHAAFELGADIPYAPQYRRAQPDVWPGAAWRYTKAPD